MKQAPSTDLVKKEAKHIKKHSTEGTKGSQEITLKEETPGHDLNLVNAEKVIEIQEGKFGTTHKRKLGASTPAEVMPYEQYMHDHCPYPISCYTTASKLFKLKEQRKLASLHGSCKLCH